MNTQFRVLLTTILSFVTFLITPAYAAAEPLFIQDAESFDAARGVIVSASIFPDRVFREYIEEYLDTDGNLVLTQPEIEAVTEMDVHGFGIADLTGIEYFTNLIILNCSENRLTALDVSSLPKLEYLYCQSNYEYRAETDEDPTTPSNDSGDPESTPPGDYIYPSDQPEDIIFQMDDIASFDAPMTHGGISTLNVGSVPLKRLWCWDNRLTALDLRMCPTLEDLNCAYNHIEALDVSCLPKLKHLTCSENALLELDISANPELAYLWCWDNELERLDITQCPKLMEVMREGNHTEQYDGYVSFFDAEADLSFSPTTVIYQGLEPDGIPISVEFFPDENFRKLVRMLAEQNYDGALSEGEIASVEEFDCLEENIASLEGIKIFTSLKFLYIGQNRLTELDVSGMPALELLNCQVTEIGSLNASRMPTLEELNCSGSLIEELNASSNTALKTINLRNNYIAALDVSDDTALEELVCCDNHIVSLDVSGNTSLRRLNSGVNLLTELDVSGLSALEELDCSYNQITKLNMTGAAALRQLQVQSNQLDELDLHTNKRLRVLWCWYNPLQSLDLTMCPILSTLAQFGMTEKYGGNQGDYISYYDKGETGDLSIDFTLAEHLVFSDSILLDSNYFPDQNFLAYVRENIDTNADEILDRVEINAVREIDCASMEIADLTGIAYFEALSSLSCGNNSLHALQLDSLHALEKLDCAYNQLSVLDTGRNPALLSLDCSHNLISELTLSNNYLLEKLNCAHNQLRSLNLVDCDTIITHLRSKPEPVTEDGVCTYSDVVTMDGEEREVFFSYDAAAVLWINPYPIPDCVMPLELERIEAHAFENCDFACVKLGNRVTEINDYAFADCSNLQYIYIPQSVNTLAPNAFEHVIDLTFFGVPGSKAETYASEYGLTFIALH